MFDVEEKNGSNVLQCKECGTFITEIHMYLNEYNVEMSSDRKEIHISKPLRCPYCGFEHDFNLVLDRDDVI